MSTEFKTKVKDLLSEGYAPFKIIEILKEDGIPEEEVTHLIELLEMKTKNSKKAYIGYAVLAGFLLMILCAALWALIALQTGSDFFLINLLIGASIGYIMRSVSRNSPKKIIPVLAVAFAICAIFLGDVIFHMAYWHEEFLIEAGSTPFLQYMLTNGFWGASWDIITNRNLMDMFWMGLSGVMAYVTSK